MAKITFADKETYTAVPGAEKYKLTAANTNEIKNSVNALYDLMALLKAPIVYSITAADFTGGYFTKTDTIGLTPGTGFQLYTNEGSGTLLNEGAGKGYVFNPALGRITTDIGNYILIIFKPLT